MKLLLVFLLLLVSIFAENQDHKFFGSMYPMYGGGYPMYGGYPRVIRRIRVIRPMYGSMLGSMYNPYVSRIW